MKYSTRHLNSKDILISFVLMVVAGLIRAPGLGRWCLTSDEFFLYKPVEYILQRGIPSFPGGGYYVRGILLQYLIAIPVATFQNKEFALRLIPLIFGVVSIPMFYVLSRKFMGIYPSFICALILLFSSWHIEFSRFGRFYTPFQFLFILFIYLFYIGFWENKRREKFISLVVAFISIFVFEASVFIPLIILTFLILNDDMQFNRNSKMVLFLFSIFLILCNLLVNKGGYSTKGVSNLYPIEYEQMTTSLAYSSFIVPSVDLYKYLFEHSHLIMLYLFAITFPFIIYLVLIKKKHRIWEIIFLAAVIIFSTLHLYALLFIATIMLVMNREETKKYFLEYKKIYILYIFISLIFWVSIIILTGNINKTMHYLVGYPPFKRYMIIPFFNSVPFWSILFFGIIIYSTVKNVFIARKEHSIASRFMLTIIYVCVVIVPMFNLEEQTTRYSFFYFPMVVALGFIEINELCFKNKRLERKYRAYLPNGILVLIPFVFFMVTEDFHINHILDVSSVEANFRIGKYTNFQDHWFERWDNESPAKYVNQNYQKGDVVLIDSITVAKYLEEKAVFYSPITSVWFPQFSRKFGREEKFTGYPMVYNIPSIIKLIPTEANKSLWMIAAADIRKTIFFNQDEMVQPKIYLRQEAIDGRHKVWQIHY